MLTSIASGLGIGSGIDTKALVSELAANARNARELQIAARDRTNTARISAIATLKSGIQSIATDYAASIAETDAAGLKKLANAFVTGFNLLRGQVADATRIGTAGTAGGPLAGDSAARALASEMARLPQTELAATGTYRSLSDIGISVTRSGTLAIDNARFDAALAAQPAEVTALLTGTAGLTSALNLLELRVTAPNGPLSVSASRYERVAKAIAKDLDRMQTDNARLVERLTKSFAGMDRQVAQLKAVQSYVEQQVAAWNSQK